MGANKWTKYGCLVFFFTLTNFFFISWETSLLCTSIQWFLSPYYLKKNNYEQEVLVDFILVFYFIVTCWTFWAFNTFFGGKCYGSGAHFAHIAFLSPICLSKETYSTSANCARMSYLETCSAYDLLSLIIKWDILFSDTLNCTIRVVLLLLILCDSLTEVHKSISSVKFVEKQRVLVRTKQIYFHSCR